VDTVAPLRRYGAGEAAPERLLTDYIELMTLILMFIGGGPINLAACNEMRCKTTPPTRLDLLKKHLNYSDLLVLFAYVPGRVCW
jgi:hypothetical protein